ncbi:hypothetical protein FQN57_002816 [Myotisia sp. PD_48]|nr:hypothetical protein FQN57_002816 [Myotisia sp. PD_48]
MKYSLIHKLVWDDKFILVAQGLFLIQCGLTSLAASRGLGQSLDNLSRDSINGFLKAEYASVPFLLLTFAFVKWSIAMFIKQLSPNSFHQSINLGLSLMVGLWLLVGILVSLFQCAMPTPWDYISGSNCVDRRGWWTFIALGNVITDIGIVALYFLIIWKLQMPRLKKIFVLTILSSRLLVVGAAIAQLGVFWNHTYMNHNTNAARNAWVPVIINQVVICLSIVTACLPYLKTFMESLESGVTRVGIIPSSEEDLSRPSIALNGYYSGDANNSVTSSHIQKDSRG